jgi:NAD(P)-dependent dehydrogenase (short-subunit alcohol dehydrogenase family)
MENIIITGSSNGFGLKAAKDFADKGNKVFATMRNPSSNGFGLKAAKDFAEKMQVPKQNWKAILQILK